jgi:hypothetical protein
MRCASAVVAALLMAVGTVQGEQALHERIDELIEAGLKGSPAAVCSDADFVRRTWLDLAGCIPPGAEARAFIIDPSSDKRQRLIDRLLASSAFARRMQYVFDVMLQERRADKHVPAAEWQEYLLTSFVQNKPLDKLAREILAANGQDPQFRAPAKFYLDREAEPNLLTRDVGRLFLGRDMQCAQCHDHPLIDGYKQAHYYGLFSFLSRSYLFTDAKAKRSFLAEKGEGGVEFKSVFDPDKKTHQTGPRLIDGPALEEPQFAKGQEHYAAPTKDAAGVPRYSRREQLARLAASGATPEFNRNLANRLWALLMGRGLVQPVDMHHPDNPPSHPELLDLLSEQILVMKFDVKAFLRQLALTRTYQRSSELPEAMDQDDIKPARFAVAPLKPLSPEQMAWSLMEATGLIGPQRDAERARLQGDARLEALFETDAKRQALKESLIERAVYAKLQGNVGPFVSLYGGAPGEPEQDFQATVQQALFFGNAGTVKTWLTSGATSLVGRLSAMPDANAAVEELYLSTLSRLPEGQERLEAMEYVIRNSAKPQAIEEMAWALLASSEFRFNH